MKVYSLLPTWKKGKDSKKPNTRPTYVVRPIRTPLSDPRGELRLARGLPVEALDRAPRLRLARG